MWQEHNYSRHRGGLVQARILEQKKRDGGGYEVKAELPGGYVIDKIPVAAGNRFVGGGASHSAWLSIRNGDNNHFEAQWLSGDPAKEFTPTEASGFVQNPNNPEQRVAFFKDRVELKTDGKPVKINDRYTITHDGKIQGPNGVQLDLETGEMKGSALSIDLNTGKIIGNIQLSGNLVSTGNISDAVNTP